MSTTPPRIMPALANTGPVEAHDAAGVPRRSVLAMLALLATTGLVPWARAGEDGLSADAT
ncbi:hypothetical protein KEU06_01425 [Pseudaminobacter sp. 19-2017]|uniref:Uncharacterized protein n=1 Tax=Pseudaminobacter soli (ex Zhang et al. 2022) TaxID=2831468 RepID=A0A942I1U0_9HYPH|nr:hypothetical protein [Pseudaminobacter soli]MBS3647284.1 hypothetical protein [Pseudaminobacter soli]